MSEIHTTNGRLIVRQNGTDFLGQGKIELYGVLLGVPEEVLATLGSDDNLIDCEIIIRPRRVFTPYLPAPGATIATMLSKDAMIKNEDWGKPKKWEQ